MKADVSAEQRFIAGIDAFEFTAQDIEAMLRSLDAWTGQLERDLEAHRLAWPGLTAHHALAQEAGAINAILRDGVEVWAQQWSNREAVRALANRFDDKLLLLVFGKFNAGKSSFCNLLAERFAAHGKSVEYFHVDAGQLVETSARFEEGTTETTARLQGVRLAHNLVLLDTPGLHSVTPENAALTQRFTESADGVLWLTSSASPGQVQELDQLGRELHRHKPLLPVVTRSDFYDEDEIDGEIRKCLCNKTAENRAGQEADVEQRAKDKLIAMNVETTLLRTPVSVSAYMAREQNQGAAAMIDAGFERLYAALIAMTEPALAYKRRKLAEVVLHDLEENVLGRLSREALPRLSQWMASLESARASLAQQQEQIAHVAWRSVIPTLPTLLERHAAARDVSAVRASVGQSVREAFEREANRRMGDYVFETDVSLAAITLNDDIHYESITVEAQGQVVGIDYSRLYAALEAAIRTSLARLASDAAAQCRAALDRLAERAASLEAVIEQRERDLHDLKRELRHP
ncbi:dynamin family protein [Paraburkholderia sp. J67]|uniref:dynamin family protein n=1 Tax=Paraburkholderia sp. J67 TaxID=2805435 RepID=UPI002ABD2CB7|nr:dynamin family protein [Paraburkholderia sp. J67]